MVEISSDNYQKQQKITSRIDRLLAQIEKDTAYHSSMRPALEHPAFAELVSMGDKIIPYLFHVATQHGANWVLFALFSTLSGTNPVPPEDAGKFQRTMMHWLKWYTENEKYKNVDVYFGLV